MAEAAELAAGAVVSGGDSALGWDESIAVNETVDAHGDIPAEGMRGFGQADTTSPHRRRRDDPGVQKLRAHLQESNGLPGLEVCEPDDLDRIERLFTRDGFVCVANILTKEELEKMRAGCSRAVAQLLSAGEDAQRGGRKYLTESGRLPHRYSLGTCSASRHMLHDPAWADISCTATTGPILARLLGPDFAVKGAGGDLCLPGAIEYQHLHRVRPAAALRLLLCACSQAFCWSFCFFTMLSCAVSPSLLTSASFARNRTATTPTSASAPPTARSPSGASPRRRC